MKRFDVLPVVRRLSVGGKDRLVVVLQHDNLDVLTTTVVAPLFSRSEYQVVARLTPVVMVKGREYVVAVDRLAALPKSDLGKVVANLESARLELMNATDFLFTGF